MRSRVAVPALVCEGQAWPLLSDAHVEAAVRGQLRIVWRDQPLSLRLSPDELVAFETATKAGYLVARSGRTRLTQAYFYWCAAAGRPFVQVRTGSPYARV